MILWILKIVVQQKLIYINIKSMTPSKYQQAIYNEYNNTSNNLAIEACPGSGKTTTLLELLKRTPEHKSSIFLAFNKSIADELKSKVPSHSSASTLHSIGFKTLIKYTHKQYKVSAIKNWILGKKILNIKAKNPKQESLTLFTISALVDLYRMNMCTCLADLEKVSIKYNITVVNGELKQAMQLIEYLDKYNNQDHGNQQMMIDFVDMIYLPLKMIPEDQFPKYSVVLVDECQDLSSFQYAFVSRLLTRRSRLISCGDEKQCQPAGTKILMRDGTEKNIEDIEIGDDVVSYDTKWKGGFINYTVPLTRTGKINSNFLKKSTHKVLNTSKRFYSENLIRLQSKGKESFYTPDHICMVRWREDKTKAHVLYLMRKGDFFRIGITPLWTTNKTGSVTGRAKGERADQMWLLDIFESRRDAYFAEQYYSVIYSIPQMVFTYGNQSIVLTQEEIDKYYNKFDKKLLLNNAINILSFFNKRLDCPFWDRSQHNYNSKLHMFKIYTCNIFKDYMQVVHYNREHVKYRKCDGIGKYPIVVSDYQNIDSLEYIPYNGFVYSLDVEKYHNYVADGILTHNCIYSFMGADSDVFDTIKSRPNTTVLPLSFSYRCPKKIIERANQVFNVIESPEWQIEGEIVENGSINDVQPGDFVLCRNNKPLIEAFLYLLKQKVPCKIMGKDYGSELLKVLLKIEDFSTESKNKIIEEKATFLKEKGIHNYQMHNSYVSLIEKISILDELHGAFKSIYDMTQVIESMFSDEQNTEYVILSTIHRSKGLEADNIFYLFKNLIPSQYAKTQLELMQEKCLEYVCITRAKKKLIYLNKIG